MKKLLNLIKKEFENNKIIYIVGIFLFFVLVYTHFNTFLANDDLPYSFLYRGDKRIVSLGQVLMHQLADYKNLNARFLVHCVLQIILMFGKNIWSIVNPLMIVTSLILIVKMVKIKIPKINNLASILLAIVGFLTIINYKYIIYWVAGSINYVWVATLLLIILYLYFCYGFCKYKVVNISIIFILCALHECTMVFAIAFLVGNCILSWIKNRKFDFKYLYYFLGFLGSLVILMSPASQIRMSSDAAWNAMGLFEKLFLAIPTVSKNLLDLTQLSNLLPWAFVLVVLIGLYSNKDKLSFTLIALIVLDIISIFIIKNDWLYFVLVLLLVFGEYYGHFKKNRLDLCVLSLAMYAIVYFNILTPLYYAARPNYYFYLYMIFYIVYIFNDVKFLSHINQKVLVCCLLVPFIFLVGNEIYVYTMIGKYHKQRLVQIEEFKENPSDTLVLTKIPQKYSYYHIDANLPKKGWFTYKYFLDYYGLPKDIDIVYE